MTEKVLKTKMSKNRKKVIEHACATLRKQKERKRKIGATKERATDDRAERKYVSQESKIKIGGEMLKVR